jgi:hypothetical protein
MAVTVLCVTLQEARPTAPSRIKFDNCPVLSASRHFSGAALVSCRDTPPSTAILFHVCSAKRRR